MVQLFNPAQKPQNNLSNVLSLVQGIGAIRGQQAQAGQRRELFPIQKQLSQTQLEQALFNLQQGRAQAPFKQEGLEARTGISQGQLLAQPGILGQQEKIRGKTLERLVTEAEASKVGLTERKRKIGEAAKTKALREVSAQDVGALESEFIGIKRPGHTEISTALKSLEDISGNLRGSPEVKAFKQFLLQERKRAQQDVPIVGPDGRLLFITPSQFSTKLNQAAALREKKRVTKKKEGAVQAKKDEAARVQTKLLHDLAIEGNRLDQEQDKLGISDEMLTQEFTTDQWNELHPKQRQSIIDFKTQTQSFQTQINNLDQTQKANLQEIDKWYKESGVPFSRLGAEAPPQVNVREEALKLINVPQKQLFDLLLTGKVTPEQKPIIEEALRLQQSQGR